MFPSFLWIVGVAIPLSFAKRRAFGVTTAQLVRQIFRRAIILYLFGALIYIVPDLQFGTMRLFGVLQRIAICYLIASLIYLKAGVRGQLIWIVSLLAAYWLAMTLIPVPGYGAGNLSVEGNLAHYVDRVVLGPHNYSETKTWDPEGIVSTAPALATTLLGILAGRLLRLQRPIKLRIIWLGLIGVLLLIAGLFCSHWLPINKKIWTDSFALVMAGSDAIALAALVWCVDELHWRRAVEPFVILGRNAIAIYVLSSLLALALDGLHTGGVSLHDWLYRTLYQPLAPPAIASLCYSICYVLLMYGIALQFYKRGWFLKV